MKREHGSRQVMPAMPARLPMSLRPNEWASLMEAITKAMVAAPSAFDWEAARAISLFAAELEHQALEVRFQQELRR
jgi:hypothetical protein